MNNKKRMESYKKLFLDKKGLKSAKKFLFRRIVVIFLLLLLQLFLVFVMMWRLNPYLEYFLGGSIGLSLAFMIYLSNSNGKNEFKIAWLIPFAVFPLFGFIVYLLYHTNLGGKNLQNRLKIVKESSEGCLPPEDSYLDMIKTYPEVEGIYRYLITHGKYYPSNDSYVEYFRNGESFYENFLDSLKAAKHFIFIEFFIIEVDESWNTILEILKKKVEEGVEVRVLYDAIGSVVASSRAYTKYLASFGLNVQVFLPLIPVFSTHQNNRDHRKIVVIDGQIGYTGGVNISNEYFNIEQRRFNYWKDNAIRIEGNAVRNLTTLFLQTWNIANAQKDNYEKYINFPVSEKITFQKNVSASGLITCYGDDAYNKQDIAEDVYLYILNQGKHYVHITTPYVVIDNQLFETLCFAAQRGVDVSIIVPSKPDHFITFCMGKIFLKKLIDQGVNVYLYDKGFIHAKTFISDDKIATVGSVNLDYRSFFHHFECGALLYDKPVICDIEADFQETLKDCKKMTAESYKEIPLFNRFIGRVFKVFAPLM